MKQKVLVSPKIDLDTIASAWLLGVTREDQVEVVRSGRASESDLANPLVLCIEVGGAGRVHEFCFDHHEAGGPKSSATRQVFEIFEWDLDIEWNMDFVRKPPEFRAVCEKFLTEGRWFRKSADDNDLTRNTLDKKRYFQKRVVEYVDFLDTQGPEVFRVALRNARRAPEDEFPTLSDVISGMLLTVREPLDQLHAGISILREVEQLWLTGKYQLELLPVGPEWRKFFRPWPKDWEDNFVRRYGKERMEQWFIRSRRVPLFGKLNFPQFNSFIEAKRENSRLLAETLERASWGQTRQGRRLAWLESNFFGAPGALYAHGAEIAVVFNPRFGNPPVPKFTVASNSVTVTPALERLNSLEPGWGGPATGTIIGSPREGSRLTLEQVVAVVIETL
jgi:hypothetical protein